jgi:hypothetical protein
VHKRVRAEENAASNDRKSAGSGARHDCDDNSGGPV